MAEVPIYRKIPEWVRDYGNSGVPDNRAVQDFMICETGESIRALQAELLGVSAGKYEEHVFDKVVGVKRRQNHGSYAEWAKAMLLWIASTKV